MVYSRKKKKSATKKKPSSSYKIDNSILNEEQPKSIENLDAIQVFDEVEDYAIIMLDTNGHILSWNRGAEKIKGYAGHEIIGKNYRIFNTGEDKETDLSEKLLKEARKQRRTSYEGWRVRKDGTRFWGSMTLTALHKEDGSLRGYLKVTRDPTDRKMAEDAHSNYVEELKIKNADLKKSEERYHKMVAEVVDYAIILLDKEGNILDWNKGAEKLKGYTPKEIIGKNFKLFYPKESKDAKLPERLLAEAVKKGRVVDEGWRIRKNGKRFWASVTITALHDDEGGVIGFSKVTRDLTERKVGDDRVGNLLEELRQANSKLKESEDRYHRMVSDVQDYAIILLDEFGNIQNWNSGAELIKGYRPQEIIGKNFKIFYTKEDQRNGLPMQLLNQAKVSGKVNHEGWRVRKDGTKFWGSVVITLLQDDGGNILGFSKVTRDLTEKKLAEDSIRSSAAQLDLKNKLLERLNQELASFSNVASHDLKEPLRKIETYAYRIKEAQFKPDKSEEYLSKIVEGTSKMRNLIEDLLAYSQVTNEEIIPEAVDLNKVMSAVKGDLEVLIQEKAAMISWKKLPTIIGVSHQLHQLFMNLISNAIKFSKQNTEPIISIESKVIKGPDIPGAGENGQNQYYHIIINDNGIGFNKEDSAKIFEPFSRLHSKALYSGTGLGLAIVKKIVENHNGIITTESEVGVGSTFNIYLPLKKEN